MREAVQRLGQYIAFAFSAARLEWGFRLYEQKSPSSTPRWWVSRLDIPKVVGSPPRSSNRTRKARRQTAADQTGQTVVIDAKYVEAHIGDLARNVDLSRFIL